MGNVLEKSTAEITLKGSHFKKIDGIVKGHDRWLIEDRIGKSESTYYRQYNSLAVNQLIIKWEDNAKEYANVDINNRATRGLQKEISFSLYCKNCETSQNLNGEILVHTANRHEMITTIDLERFMTLDRLKFFPLSKNSVDNNSDVDMIELELKPLFPDQKLPISNAYIRYCLK